ncbi:MAG: MFS transporter [Acidimicrobiia bacterium]
MRAFFVVWVGQLVSITGTTLTAFGLQLYVFAETGSVTNLSLVALAYTVPAIILAPLAGSVADRADRRVVMLGADAVAGAATLITAALFFADALELWHIYLLVATGSGANAFQEPAWLASVTLLVPTEQLPRANGLVQLNVGLSFVIAPAAAGALLVTVGLGGVLLVDVATFLIGVITLAIVRFPRATPVGGGPGDSWVSEAVFAWRYLRDRPGLFGMLWIFAGVNFMLSFGNVLIIPLVVSIASEASAGAVVSAAGLGAVTGSLVVSAWGGPKKLVAGIMAGMFVGGLLTSVAGLRSSVPLIGVAFVLMLVVMPIVNALSQTIWQRKVEAGIQGRVFSLRRMISSAVSPLAILAAGPLADSVFEPRLQPGGALADSVGAVIGTGPGRGIGFLFVLSGFGMMILAVYGYSRPRIRGIESEIPDAEVLAAGD